MVQYTSTLVSAALLPGLILGYLMSGAIGAPLDGPAIPNNISEPMWVPEPSGRGTFSLLCSSAMTIVLCVYTVLHTNTLPNAGTVERIFYKLKWVAIGIFVPEALLVGVLIDWDEARKLRQEWCRKKNIVCGSPEDVVGMDGAYFVCMGGFSVGRSEDYSNFGNILTPDGFLFLLDRGLAPHDIFRKRAIEDKAKADLVMKGLVCLQALWMLVQCALRKFGRLPISLLELHIAMHVLFTLLIYVLWINKPLNVEDPIPVITDPDLASMMVTFLSKYSDSELAWLSIRMVRPSKQSEASEGNDIGPRPLTLEICNPNKKISHQLVSESAEKIYCFVDARSKLEIRKYGYKTEAITAGSKGALRDDEYLVLPTEWLRVGTLLDIRARLPSNTRDEGMTPTSAQDQGSSSVAVPTLDKTDIQNLVSTARAIEAQKHGHLIQELGTYSQNHGVGFTTLVRLRTKMFRTEEWSYSAATVGNAGEGGSGASGRPFGLRNIMIFMLVALFYGGWHALAWNSHFPTQVENELWKVCSVVVAGVPCVIGAIAYLNGTRCFRFLVGELHDFCLWSFKYGCVRLSPGKFIWRCLVLLIYTIGGCIFGCFVFARLFLVFEAFLSVRSLPIGSYKTTAWEDIVPHF